MILSDKRILEEIEKKTIIIRPYDRSKLGTNSYDVHLGKNMAVYIDKILDAKKHNEIKHFEIPEDGYILQPNELYLGVTAEYTETHAHVPFLEGKSSTGRLGIDIHATAGKGDVGFCGALDIRNQLQSAGKNLCWYAHWTTHLLSGRRRSGSFLRFQKEREIQQPAQHTRRKHDVEK